MQVNVENVSKRFGYQTILKNVHLHIPSGGIVNIGGLNGSGKSTLLRIISSYLSPSEGSISYISQDKSLPHNDVATKVSYAAPYIQATQEFHLNELMTFHQRFRPFYHDLSYKEFVEILELPNPKQKQIRQFSSGMQQKVYLALSILSKGELLLLDEPTSYLDVEAKAWYKNLLNTFLHDRTLVIASNETTDFIGDATHYRIQDGQLLS